MSPGLETAARAERRTASWPGPWKPTSRPWRRAGRWTRYAGRPRPVIPAQEPCPSPVSRGRDRTSLAVSGGVGRVIVLVFLDVDPELGHGRGEAGQDLADDH